VDLQNFFGRRELDGVGDQVEKGLFINNPIRVKVAPNENVIEIQLLSSVDRRTEKLLNIDID
jgi:hypothetical protein